MTTGVIIVSYHSNVATEILTKRFRDEKCFDFICIVVNDTKQEDKAYFKHLESEEISVLYNEQNLGYAKGNNIGLKFLIKNKHCDFIAISNNDIGITKGSVEYLFTQLEKNKNYGALAPVMLDANGNRVPLRFIDLGYLRIFLRIFSSETSIDRKTEGKLLAHDGIINQTFLPGSFFAVSSKAIRAADYFDEKTFLYREEEILGKRLLQAGYKEGVLKNITYRHNHKYHDESIRQKKNSLRIALDSEKYYFDTYVCKTSAGKLYVMIVEKLFYISRSCIWRVEQMAKSIYAVLVQWGGGRANHRLH